MKTSFNLIVTALLVLSFVAVAQKRDQEERGARSKSFTVEQGGRLEVNVRSGDITISPWNKNEVYVNADGIDPDDLDRLIMTQSGNSVRVEFRPRSRSWDWGGGTHFMINVPAEFNVNLKTSGGDLEVTDALTGRIEGTTSGGEIRLADVTGTVDMGTSGGDIRVGNIKGNVKLRTSGGNIELRRVDGETSVSTSGGNIRVESVGKRLVASTSGGDIDVGDVGGEAKLSTAGGEVKVGKVSGDARLSTAGGDIELRGASGKVVAKTAGGDIVLENVTGSIEAKTAGGDIRAELLPSGKGSSELKTAGGDIRLNIPENARATIEALIRLEGRWGLRRERYEVKSDFSATTYDKREDEIHATYLLNGGGEKIYLETVNSNIEIRKLRR